MDNSKAVGWKVKEVEYKHRDVRVSTTPYLHSIAHRVTTMQFWWTCHFSCQLLAKLDWSLLEVMTDSLESSTTKRVHFTTSWTMEMVCHFLCVHNRPHWLEAVSRWLGSCRSCTSSHSTSFFKKNENPCRSSKEWAGALLSLAVRSRVIAISKCGLRITQ